MYRLAYADDDYLLKIGRLAYAVSNLEWTVLGDLPHLEHAPAELTAEALAPKSTGAIAGLLTKHGAGVQHEATRAFLTTAGDALGEVSEWRNHVLHARPATVDGQQMLFRWKPPHAFTLTPAWLDEHLQRIEVLVLEVGAARLQINIDLYERPQDEA